MFGLSRKNADVNFRKLSTICLRESTRTRNTINYLDEDMKPICERWLVTLSEVMIKIDKKQILSECDLFIIETVLSNQTVINSKTREKARFIDEYKRERFEFNVKMDKQMILEAYEEYKKLINETEEE